MGNCQAIDAAALVIQHPSGRIERLYWQVSASEVMKMNPGHYVSLIIPLSMNEGNEKSDQRTVRFTRVKLLKPTDTLNLGHAYRLVTSQEVMKVLRAKKQGKMNRRQQELDENILTAQNKTGTELQRSKSDVLSKDTGHERQRSRTPSTNSGVSRSGSKSWRPSLHSIEEAAIN